jgi:hypothetical protein
MAIVADLPAIGNVQSQNQQVIDDDPEEDNQTLVEDSDDKEALNMPEIDNGLDQCENWPT